MKKYRIIPLSGQSYEVDAKSMEAMPPGKPEVVILMDGNEPVAILSLEHVLAVVDVSKVH